MKKSNRSTWTSDMWVKFLENKTPDYVHDKGGYIVKVYFKYMIGWAVDHRRPIANMEIDLENKKVAYKTINSDNDVGASYSGHYSNSTGLVDDVIKAYIDYLTENIILK